MIKLKSCLNRLPIVVITLLAGILRLQNIGYSDYQGDEIKAFFNTQGYNSVTEFLLSQRKGPGQFIVTYLVRFFTPNYSNEFITRLPFAVAGVLAVFFFFKLVEKMFNKKIAFYASLFFATNGFFVALSRIVQYQSFVILFMVLSLYLFQRASSDTSHSKKYLFLAALSWSFSILFHYDGVFIFPLAAYFIFEWYKKNKDDGIKYLLLIAVVNAIILGSFYIPFVYNLSQSTLSYWSGRISGNVSSKISSSSYLFTVYQPIYVIHFYALLTFFGLSFVALHFKRKIRFFERALRIFPKYEFSMPSTIVIISWFFIPFLFLEGVVYIPGTHIYTYLLPLTIILALGIFFIEKSLYVFRKYIIPEVISYTFIALLFIFIFLQSYTIFVDNRQEYPWEEENFLIWKLHKPTPIFHLSMFGFPYYRNWEGISNAILSSNNNGFYSTNERKTISRHYVPFEKSTDEAGHFIHILKPQSFDEEISQDKAIYWAERYPPIFTYSKGGEDLVRVYYMIPGTLEEVIEKGY